MGRCPSGDGVPRCCQTRGAGAHPAIEPAKATRPARVGPLPHGGGRFLQLVRKGRCGPSGGADGSCFLAPNVPLVRAIPVLHASLLSAGRALSALGPPASGARLAIVPGWRCPPVERE